MSERAASATLDELVGAAAIVATVSFSPVLAWRYRRWGATDEDRLGAMPGDALVSAPKLQSTRAIDIDAPPDAVWPWLVQLGHERLMVAQQLPGETAAKEPGAQGLMVTQILLG